MTRRFVEKGRGPAQIGDYDYQCFEGEKHFTHHFDAKIIKIAQAVQ